MDIFPLPPVPSINPVRLSINWLLVALICFSCLPFF